MNLSLPRRVPRPATLVLWASAAVLAAWAALALAADRWWPATLLLFGPRWVLAVPLAVLVPAAAVCRRQALLPLLAAAVVLALPVLGFCIPPGQAPDHAGSRLT